MNRLRTRLILSYLAVVVITLVVMGLLLVLLLRGRPVASDPIYTRLISVSRLINERELATGAILSASRDTRIEQIVNGVASRTRSRVLLATVQDEVLYDSLALMEQGTFLELREMRRTPAEPELSQGNFRQGDEEWLFVMQEIPTRGGRVRLYFAALRPQSSWTEVLNLFGTSLLLPLLQAGLIGLVMAVVLAGVSSRGLVRVLGRLGAVAKGVAAGNYEERAPLEGPDEVRAVASAFNAMAEEVRASQIAQQDFLANVSHDLRTPLTSIQGFSQAIIDGTSQDSTYHAQIIYDEAGRLNRMVGELLDLARISSGRMSMKQSRVNVALVAQAVAERLSIKAQEKGVRLIRDIADVPDISGDGDRLAQIITNLIDNALAFTPEGGTVRVATRPADGGVELSVSDTGQGIPQEDLPRIFERFYQVDKSRGPRRGTGLGLAITTEIVQAHGGRISATSGGIGQGATFTVWFPALDMTTVIRRR